MRPEPSRRSPSNEDIFFIAMTIAMAIVVFIGFAASFFLSPWIDSPKSVALEPIFLIHGYVFSAWMLLLIVQASLIAGGRFSLHHLLGWLGLLLAISVVSSGVAVGLESAARPIGNGKPPKTLEFLGVILFGIFMFAAMTVAAITLRRKPQYHKRLMLLATINLLQAAVVRLPIDLPGDFGQAKTFLYANLFILPLVVWDLSNIRRIHPATLWGGLAILVSLPVRFWFSDTDVWLVTAAWAVSHVK